LQHATQQTWDKAIRKTPLFGELRLDDQSQICSIATGDGLNKPVTHLRV